MSGGREEDRVSGGREEDRVSCRVVSARTSAMSSSGVRDAAIAAMIAPPELPEMTGMRS